MYIYISIVLYITLYPNCMLRRCWAIRTSSRCCLLRSLPRKTRHTTQKRRATSFEPRATLPHESACQRKGSQQGGTIKGIVSAPHSTGSDPFVVCTSG